MGLRRSLIRGIWPKLLWLFLIVTVTHAQLVFPDEDSEEDSDEQSGPAPDLQAAPSINVYYSEWRPINHGHPMNDDPTLVYVPPALDNVHFGPDPPPRKPIYPILPENPPVYIVEASANPSKISSVYGTPNSQFFKIPGASSFPATTERDVQSGISYVRPPQFVPSFQAKNPGNPGKNSYPHAQEKISLDEDNEDYDQQTVFNDLQVEWFTSHETPPTYPDPDAPVPGDRTEATVASPVAPPPRQYPPWSRYPPGYHHKRTSSSSRPPQFNINHKDPLIPEEQNQEIIPFDSQEAGSEHQYTWNQNRRPVLFHHEDTTEESTKSDVTQKPKDTTSNANTSRTSLYHYEVPPITTRPRPIVSKRPTTRPELPTTPVTQRPSTLSRTSTTRKSAEVTRHYTKSTYRPNMITKRRTIAPILPLDITTPKSYTRKFTQITPSRRPLPQGNRKRIKSSTLRPTRRPTTQSTSVPIRISTWPPTTMPTRIPTRGSTIVPTRRPIFGNSRIPIVRPTKEPSEVTKRPQRRTTLKPFTSSTSTVPPFKIDRFKTTKLPKVPNKISVPDPLLASSSEVHHGSPHYYVHQGYSKIKKYGYSVAKYGYKKKQEENEKKYTFPQFPENEKILKKTTPSTQPTTVTSTKRVRTRPLMSTRSPKRTTTFRPSSTYRTIVVSDSTVTPTLTVSTTTSKGPISWLWNFFQTKVTTSAPWTTADSTTTEKPRERRITTVKPGLTTTTQAIEKVTNSPWSLLASKLRWPWQTQNPLELGDKVTTERPSLQSLVTARLTTSVRPFRRTTSRPRITLPRTRPTRRTTPSTTTIASLRSTPLPARTSTTTSTTATTTTTTTTTTTSSSTTTEMPITHSYINARHPPIDIYNKYPSADDDGHSLQKKEYISSDSFRNPGVKKQDFSSFSNSEDELIHLPTYHVGPSKVTSSDGGNRQYVDSTTFRQNGLKASTAKESMEQYQSNDYQDEEPLQFHGQSFVQYNLPKEEDSLTPVPAQSDVDNSDSGPDIVRRPAYEVLQLPGYGDSESNVETVRRPGYEVLGSTTNPESQTEDFQIVRRPGYEVLESPDVGSASQAYYAPQYQRVHYSSASPVHNPYTSKSPMRIHHTSSPVVQIHRTSVSPARVYTELYGHPVLHTTRPSLQPRPVHSVANSQSDTVASFVARPVFFNKRPGASNSSVSSPFEYFKNLKRLSGSRITPPKTTSTTYPLRTRG